MILLTGVTGLLGPYLVENLLAKGHSLRLLVRNPEKCSFQPKLNLEIVQGDVLDLLSLEAAMQGITQVVHAAALVSFAPQRREEMMRINVGGTANLVNLCLLHKAKLVLVSSIAALGRSGDGELISEKTRWKESPLNSQYAVSKYRAELEIHRGVEEGLSAAIVNPGLILGAGKWDEGSGKVFSMVYKGMPFYNEGINGMVGAADVAEGIRLVLESEYNKGERFVLVAENWDQKQLFSAIAGAFGKKPPKLKFPEFLTQPAGLASELLAKITGKEPVVTRETMRNAINKYRYDGSFITQTLGLKYQPLQEVVKEVCKLFPR